MSKYICLILAVLTALAITAIGGHADQMKWERQSLIAQDAVNATDTGTTSAPGFATPTFRGNANSSLDFVIPVPQRSCDRTALKDFRLVMAYGAAITPSEHAQATNSTYSIESRKFDISWGAWKAGAAFDSLTALSSQVVNATGVSPDVAAGEKYEVLFPGSIVDMNPGDRVLLRVRRVSADNADNATAHDPVLGLDYMIQTCTN